MHIGEIIKFDIVNGLGVRLSVFVSGCRNQCDHCFNKQAWDFNYGYEYTEKMEDSILEELRLPQYDGLTILGGEPFEPENQPQVKQLIERVRKELPDKNIWVYTGYNYEDLQVGGKCYVDGTTDVIIHNIDVLVDGKFEVDKKDLTLKFRGSSNQRLINIPASIENGKVVLL